MLDSMIRELFTYMVMKKSILLMSSESENLSESCNIGNHAQVVNLKTSQLIYMKHIEALDIHFQLMFIKGNTELRCCSKLNYMHLQSMRKTSV